jgi:hypothetical protein
MDLERSEDTETTDGAPERAEGRQAAMLPPHHINHQLVNSEHAAFLSTAVLFWSQKRWVHYEEGAS